MKYNRIKNASRNMAFSLLQRIYSLIVPFFIRTLFIYTMGIQYLGLDSLFTSILSVLSLAELGVGSAMVYSMYKPLAEDDTDTVCALMRLYKIYYRIIGLVILIFGLCITPFLPFIIKDSLPADLNLYILYLFNLASVVVTYWLFAYKNCIINANQRMDVNTKINLGITTLTYLAQIFVLLTTHNYYLYISVKIITSILSNIVTAVVADRMFPGFKAKGILPKSVIQNINQKVRDLFTAKIATVIIYSVDTIVISAFLGLTVLARYQNYLYVMSAVSAFLGIIYSSMTSILGNSLVVESPDKNYHDFRIFLFIIGWIAGFCTTCFLCLYQPFMELWMGKDLMLDFGVVICFCIYFFVGEVNKLLNLYKDASGMWHSDRFRPLVISLLNLGLNLASVQFFGLYGILLSTAIPMAFVGYAWLVRNLCHEIFAPHCMKSIFIKIIRYTVITAIASGITFFLCSFIHLNSVLNLFLRAIICMIVPNLLFLAAYRYTADFQLTIVFINQKFFKNRLNRVVSYLTHKKKG